MICKVMTLPTISMKPVILDGVLFLLIQSHAPPGDVFLLYLAWRFENDVLPNYFQLFKVHLFKTLQENKNPSKSHAHLGATWHLNIFFWIRGLTNKPKNSLVAAMAVKGHAEG